jgi:hypothetical protein
MKSALATSGLIFFLLSAEAQIQSLFVNDNVDRRIWEQSFEKADFKFHTAFRSYDRTLRIDSASIHVPDVLRASVHPLIDLSARAWMNDSVQFSSTSIAGIGWSSSFGERWNLDIAILGGAVYKPLFAEQHTASANVIEGYGRSEGEDDLRSFWDVNGRLRFQAAPQFRLEIGKAKNFLGDGYRSFFLSDNAAPYPYLRIDTKVWHVQYMNLYSWQQGMLNSYGPSKTFENKFTTTHLLSWNVTELINFQIFETIIWQGEDSLSNRGYDVSYLNPIIFYRPVEFASGSADNAILGIAASVKVWPHYQWYTQLAIDEFLLSEFTNRTGWWGNKFGFQMGVKGHDFAGVNGLYMQAEMNMARPFTYSHGSPLQSYTHMNQALAHPSGANFYEYLLIANYTKKDWEFRGLFSFNKHGADQFGANLGGDIFRSYVNPFQSFNNLIGQGLATELYRADLKVSWVLDPARDTRIQLGYDYRYYGGEIKHQQVHGIMLSLRSSLGDGY